MLKLLYWLWQKKNIDEATWIWLYVDAEITGGIYGKMNSIKICGRRLFPK